MSLMDHSAFISPEFLIRAASAAWELQGVSLLRRRVFVEEQHIFVGDDRDEIDKTSIPLVAISTLAAEAADVVGTVRIHEPEPASGGVRALRSLPHIAKSEGWVRS